VRAPFPVAVILLVACASASRSARQQGTVSTVRLEFQAPVDSFEASASEYRRIWLEDGERIVRTMEAVSGLRFNSPVYADTAITVILVDAPSNSGYRERAMRMRFSYPTDTKKATLIHELGHRLQSPLFRREDEHAELFLWIYDVWVELYGQPFADAQVIVERRRGGVYPGAWDSALALNRTERQARWRAIVAERSTWRR
jgi:hypothetical protein